MKRQKNATNSLKATKNKLSRLFAVGLVFCFCLGVDDYCISHAFSEYATDVVNYQEDEHDVIPQIEDEAIQNEESSSFLNKLGRFLTFSGRNLRVQTEEQFEEHSRKRVQIFVYKSRKEKSHQYMSVEIDGQEVHQFVVSTAWERKRTTPSGRVIWATTPNGKFLPDGMQEKRYSNTFKVWLRYVIRFNGGIWIHATTSNHYGELGQPASAGCVRMHLDDAKILYDLVSYYGLYETAITIIPAPGEPQVPTPRNI